MWPDLSYDHDIQIASIWKSAHTALAELSPNVAYFKDTV